MGCLCDMNIAPWGALLLGCVGGAVACTGINYVTPFLEDHLKIHDTCDCMALHGICAFFSVFASCIAHATKSNEGYLCDEWTADGNGVYSCSGTATTAGIVTGKQ